MKQRLKWIGVLLVCAAVLRLAALAFFPQNGGVQQAALVLFLAVWAVCGAVLGVCVILWLLRRLKKR